MRRWAGCLLLAAAVAAVDALAVRALMGAARLAAMLLAMLAAA